MYIYIYSIQHYGILWSSYRKDHWIPFRRSNQLRYQAMSSRFQGYCLRQLPRSFELKVSSGNHESVAEWADTYGIHHWRILWSSYRELAWVGFEPMTTEFHSDVLTDSAIRPLVQLSLRADFVRLLQFHHFFSVTFHFNYCLRQLPRLIELKVSEGNHMSVAD